MTTTTELGWAEGDACGRAGCDGVIEIRPPENCSCHLSAPCSACAAPRNHCPECGWDEADEPRAFTMNDYEIKADRQTGAWLDWKPRPLDPTRIDYRSLPHSSCSMIKEGVYPPSGDDAADRERVRREVDGTFGGRFEYFGSGKFKFIAYTD
ncbi:hypothetical protein [Castellaniella sp.]|uniref:hypothetical protein n=1 Tax=Castellaniella sp. TaxID=1955812 RepID=UPI003C7248B3